MEQYSWSNSNINEESISELRESDEQAIDAKNSYETTSTETPLISQLSICSDMEHCTPVKNERIQGGLNKSTSFTGTNSASNSKDQSSGNSDSLWNQKSSLETLNKMTGGNVREKQGPTKPYSSQSHHSLPESSALMVSTTGVAKSSIFVNNNKHNWKRSATASKSFSAINSVASSVQTKHVVPLQETGDNTGELVTSFKTVLSDK